MGTTTLEQLEFLHDCVTDAIVYDSSHVGERLIRIAMTCPPDLGQVLWNGRRIILEFVDVAASRHMVWSTAGQEVLNAVRAGISSDFDNATVTARRIGIFFPPIGLTASFHSGSTLEVICRDLKVTIDRGH